MEYLNPNPAPALPQTMWLVYRAAMEFPASTSDRLFDLVVPAVIRDKTPSAGAHFRSALSALQKLGIIEGEHGALKARKVAGAPEFLRLLRYRIVQPPNTFNESFEGAEDIRRGLVWLMRQSPSKALDYETDVAPRTSVFVNGTRWNTFRTWCDVLGFGQQALSVMEGTAGGNRIVPNPTRAVVDAIAKPFGDPMPRAVQLPIGRLVEFLQHEVPVLPGHPSAIYEGMEDDDGALRAIGLALTAAEEMKVLTLQYQSDPSGVMALPDAQHGETRYVSSVTIDG